MSAAGKDYDGNPVRATCTIMHGSFSVSAELLKNITQYEISDIKYMKTSASGVTTGGEALSAAPSISGHYYAKVELKVDAGTTKTVVKAFDITGNRVAIPVAATGLTYNGTSQVGVASGNYILTGTPEAVNAGNYSVTAKLSDVSSCMWSDGTITDKVFSYSIAPKDITVTITANGGTYGGTITPATATLHGVVGTDTVPVTLTYTGRVHDGTSYNSQTPPTLAGTYTVSASISDTNYNLTGTKTAAFVVQKKKIDVPTAATGLIYNGTQQVGVATGVYDLLGNPNAVSAGGYTATAKLRNTENYMWSDGTITDKALSYRIAPKDITVTITANGGTYGGTITPATATLHGVVGTDTVPVTLTYTGRVHDGTSYNSQTPPTLAGTYTVSASISDTNYNLAGTKTDNYIVANGEASKPQELPKEESKPQNPEPVNEGKVEVNEGEDDDNEASEDVSAVPNTSDATPVKGYGILLMVSVTGMILACKDSRISKKGR
ncbi:MAG: MBG domain-containing protein [Lachnospiraceae bacterium]